MIFLSFTAFLAVVLGCVITGQNLLWALWFGITLFAVIARKRGHSFKAICAMAWKKGRTALVVIPVLLIIGTVTGLWRASGTIACFLYHGLRLISPTWFILMAFLLSAAMSFLLGSAFGVASTAGVVLITIARSGGVDLSVAAGAIISGAFFGDRCSPMASGAALVAACTRSNLYTNIREMLKTGVLPTLLTVVFYAFLSLRHPITAVDPEVLSSLSTGFHLSLWTLLPAVLMLTLPLFKVPIKLAMAVSALLALILSVTLQGMPLTEALRCALLGFSPEGPLAAILSGGGIISMVKASCIVMSTSLLAGILDGLDALSAFTAPLNRFAEACGTFPAMVLTSTLVSCCFCNQSVAIVMSEQLMASRYRAEGLSDTTLAIDIENSAVMIAGLVPWSIAVAIPLSMMNAPSSSILFAALLYFTPLCYLFTRRFHLAAQQERS